MDEQAAARPQDAGRPGQAGPAEARGENHSARRVNRLLRALGGTRYLEVGVNKGHTFHRVRAEHKVAVDPKFQFPVDPKPGETYHEITSDAYFTEHASGPFDVMFIDGLHTFEQTFRDFCASMVHARPGTVWLVDDTVPNDVYSTLPTPRDTRRFRTEAGITSNQWHGDVYKVVFAIADFFPNLSYATIMGSANPQTLVWAVPRVPFKPVFNSLETISRLDYFALQRHVEVLNGMSEDDALTLAIAGAEAARNRS